MASPGSPTFARASIGRAGSQDSPNGTGSQKRMTQRLVRLERAREPENDALRSHAVRLGGFLILQMAGQLRASGMETPRHRRNVESLEHVQSALDAGLGAAPVLYPRLGKVSMKVGRSDRSPRTFRISRTYFLMTS